MNDLFQKLDQNGNKALDYTEFVAAAIDKKLALSEEKIKNCFSLLDKNQDGNISVEEFKEVLQGEKKQDNEAWNELIFQVTGNRNQKEINLNQFRAILKKIEEIS